jgi:AcrR family transcriptional regulator
VSELQKGPHGRRRGRGARERILAAAQQLFREQGINSTGMDQLCAVAQVSKRTAYQHFGSKDELIAEYLRRLDPDTMPEVFERTDLTPRERLLAVFANPLALTNDATPLCPFIAAAVEVADPKHPARGLAREYKKSVAARLAETAREAGATEGCFLVIKT